MMGGPHMTLARPKDEDGVPLKHGDYITFTFGIPPICVTARVSEGSTGWGVECLHPADVKPKRTTLQDLTKHYQIWKASKQRVAAILRAIKGGMGDRLRMDYINSLPQPFVVRLYGHKDWWWPVYDIEVQVALIRIDVCGKLQVCDFSDVAEIKDGAGEYHNPDDWWHEDDND